MLVLWASAASSAGSTTRSRSGGAQCAAAVRGHAMAAGHFIPEELPVETSVALLDFLHG